MTEQEMDNILQGMRNLKKLPPVKLDGSSSALIDFRRSMRTAQRVARYIQAVAIESAASVYITR